MKRVPYQPTLPKSVRPYQGKEIDRPSMAPYSEMILRSPISGITTEDSIHPPYLMASQGYKVRVALPSSSRVKSEYLYQRDHTKLTVGYADDLEIHYSPDDQLVYGTASHFTKKILESKSIQGDIIFIYQSPETHLLERLLRILGSPRIVLLSNSFSQPDFPIYQIPQPQSGNQIFLPPDSQITEIIRREQGMGIIFRSGVTEVNDTIRALNKSFSPNDSIKLYPAYGPVSQVQLDEIMSLPEKTKIIVGTGLTPIEEIDFTIDDLLEEVPELTSNGGVRLVQKRISQGESKKRDFGQRNYKLVDQVELTRKVPSLPQPILYQSILQLIDARLDPDQILGVSTELYQKVMIKFGLLTSNKDTLSLTPEGKFVSEIPLRFQNALMVALGYRKFLNSVLKNGDLVQEKVFLRTVIAVASMNEVYGPGFFLPLWQQPGQSDSEFAAQQKEYTDKYHRRFIGETDIHTLVNIFWEMLSDLDVAKKYDQASRNAFMNYLQEWSLNNKMSYQQLKEFFVVMRAVESIVESMIHLELDPRTISVQLRQAEILPRGTLGKQGFSLNWQLPAGGYDGLGNQVTALFAQANILNRYEAQGDGIYQNPETGLTLQEKPTGSYEPSLARTFREHPSSLIVDPISGIWVPGSSL